MIRLDQPKLMLNAHADAAGDLPANVDGFFTQERVKDDLWNIRFHPYEKPEPTGGEIVAKIDSACEPSEKVLNQQSVLVLSCPHGHDDRFVAAYSLDNRSYGMAAGNPISLGRHSASRRMAHRWPSPGWRSTIRSPQRIRSMTTRCRTRC